MASKRRSLDRGDLRFLGKRTAFLLLGALASAVLTVWVPWFRGSEAVWGPTLAMVLAGLAEAVNRFVADHTKGWPDESDW